MNNLAFVCVLAIVTIFSLDHCQGQKTFQNPILDEAAPEPSIIKHEGHYFMAFHQDIGIEILKSSTLSDFRDGERKVIFQIPQNMSVLRSPRIQSVQCDLYIYFSMRWNGSEERMYAIKSLDPKNPLGDWSPETRLMAEEHTFAIHGSTFQYNNGDLYFIWSGHSEPTNRSMVNLYIARMENPMKVVLPRTLLRVPTMDWEKHLLPVNEGSYVLQNKGATYLLFSASSVNSPDNCLGIMGIDGGRDPMLPSNWWDDVGHCVFARNDAEMVWGLGHPSFVKSPDNSETWMVYHARDSTVQYWQNNTARIQKIEWEMNKPVFPPALGTQRYLVVPKGED